MQNNLPANYAEQERITEVKLAPKAPQFVRQRLTQAAQEMSRVNELAAHTEAANEALYKLTAMLYEEAADGQWANMDPLTGQLLVPAPWGSDGWKRWGLRHWEATVLRQILRSRMTQHLALFGFRKATNRWMLDRRNYPTAVKAFQYLKTYPITAAEWREHNDSFRHKRERQRKSRATQIR